MRFLTNIKLVNLLQTIKLYSHLRFSSLLDIFFFFKEMALLTVFYKLASNFVGLLVT